jgi:hypothetical protein
LENIFKLSFLIVGELAGGAMQYKGKMGWVINRLIQDILWPQGRLHFDPNGLILLGAIWARWRRCLRHGDIRVS